VPDRWIAGEEYELAVELARADLTLAGFELSARFATGPDRGGQAGAFHLLGENAAVTEQNGIHYVHHTLAGTIPATPGRARWRIEWAAPAEGSAAILFHLAANAANGDESPLGDRVYVARARVEPSSGER
jgi:hypothetical protein